MKIRSLKNSKGIALIEILIAMSIMLLILAGLMMFQYNVFEFNRYATESLLTIQDGRVIVGTMVKELRSASPANTGAYPIAQVSTSSISFFTDTDSDNIKEKIRYFVDGINLKKGKIVPSGSQLTYNPLNESIITIATNIKNSSSTPLFEYYDTNYAGTSSPLTYPVQITDVRLVKITLIIDVDPNKSPVPRTYTSQVSLRNLKDNL